MNGFFELLIISGLLFILIGIILMTFPPKKINRFYGYRTKTSMQDQQTWDYAQQLGGKFLIYYGMVLGAFSPLGIFLTLSTDHRRYTELALLFVVISILYIHAEAKLRSFKK